MKKIFVCMSDKIITNEGPINSFFSFIIYWLLIVFSTPSYVCGDIWTYGIY